MAEELPQNDRSTNNSEKEVIEAREVFLLMKNEYRISRNTRASWYFSHINSRIDYTPKTDINDFQEELGILSITARDEQGIEYVPCGQHLYKLTPDIQVTFIALRYRLVFILDVSPSIATVDLSTSEVLYDEAFKSLEIAMKGLVQPFHVPGSQILLCPELYVTVIAHTPLVNCKANQVLMQGCLLTQKNVDNMLRVIGKALTRFEDKVAQALMEVVESDTYQEEEEEHLTGGLFEDIVEKPDTPNPILYLTSPDMSFVNLFRYGILALQLLPEKSAAGIIVITDGVVGLPEASLFESLMGQLRHSTISCSFIQIGEDFKHNAGLGHVPYSDMLSYMATSTFGTLFTRLPQLDKTSNEMNIFHQEILAWSIQKPLHQMQVQNSALLWTSLNPIMHKKHVERNLHTSISNLISCRLREGYTIQDVHLTKGDSQIEVNMVLLWRDQITILYLAVSTWPLSAAKRTTHIEVSVLAHYAFLQDVTCPGKKLFSSPYRTALVKKYWQTLQGTSETDQLLVHLQSFAMSPVCYLVPESVKKGVPLFFLLANSTTPQLNVQLSSKDASLTQFANFWKPVLMLDINIWQKWMHTHRIGLILMHDIPLGKHLHIPNSSGRFHSIMCRQAQMSLNNLLRDWSTFELLENHSYIKLLFQDPDKPPSSFYLLRVSPKPPCMVLRLAFLGGMSGKQRNEIVSQLTEKITGLTFPQRGTQKDNKQKKSSQQQLSQENLPSPRQHKPPLQIPWSDTPCCVYCHKPLEKILIRYDRMPHDFFVLDVPPMIDQSGQLSYPVSANKTAANVFTTLSRYLYHRRWVWTMQHVSSMPISMQAVGCMLSNLTKIRLQEGFRFSHASSGIVDMVLEVDMKLPCVPTESESTDTEEELHPCIVQYVIFPPHTATTKESASKDDMEEMETTEADGELQIITECWVEPQCGVIVNSTPERQHFDGLNYIQLAEAQLLLLQLQLLLQLLLLVL
ncbi:KICSTOR complex protein SZT2 [Lamellibrachia satsuma]|nr:KICSTOR complex protein SZT2 [Lamellibrachia satsuma]